MCENRRFLVFLGGGHFVLKTISFPRQARDKHREKTVEKKGAVFAQVHGVAAKCYDVLRYTCILECSKYVTGTTAILEHLNGALQPLKNKTKRNETKRNGTQRNETSR